MMQTAILGMLAETPVHPGSGRGLGVVDLPVAREAATDYPVVVGSSLKGALKDKAERTETTKKDVAPHFGEPNHAGQLLVSDARLLLLPVRSLTSSYRWATCPHLLERFGRDLKRAGQRYGRGVVPEVALGTVHTHGNGHLFLEERQFEVKAEPGDALIGALKRLLVHDETAKRLADHIAILHDDDFSWFARYGLSIQARNVLDDNKKSKNLWHEETLPADTVMYGLVAGRSDEALGILEHLFPETDPYLQVGGNETVGQGWFAVRVIRDSAGSQQ